MLHLLPLLLLAFTASAIPPPTFLPPIKPPPTCRTICIDKVNDCGIKYGGCVCVTGAGKPTFTPPPCPASSSHSISTIVAPTTTKDCPVICADYINACGQMYGGCFPEPSCTGGTAWPTFTPPPCPTTSSHSISTIVAPTTIKDCPVICADYINACGQMYGGCFPEPSCTGGTAWPTFTPPPCTKEFSTVKTMGKTVIGPRKTPN